MRGSDLVAEGMLSVPDAELFSGLKRTTLYDLMARGELIYAKCGARRLIPKRALMDYLAARLTGQQPTDQEWSK